MSYLMFWIFGLIASVGAGVAWGVRASGEVFFWWMLAGVVLFFDTSRS